MSRRHARPLLPGPEWATRSRVWERALGELGFRRIAGIDEAGRGSLAGPVVAAAVILPPDFPAGEIIDSKQLTPAQRERLYERIIKDALSVGTGAVDNYEIDRINILQATKMAMANAVASLASPPDFLLIDAVTISSSVPCWALIKGDQRALPVAAGSIVAKVTRDRLMDRLHERYPCYNFSVHKGYGTADHLARLTRIGPCAIHRRSFRPISGSRRAVETAGAVHATHGT